jgi:alcohol dehydrogenase class IV
MCAKIEQALLDFHANKQAIIDAKARQGKGNSLITNWFIPKLEVLQSVVSNIRLNDVEIQWSADITENAHIHVVKKPAHSGNNQEYESQTCRYLD